MSGNPVDAKSTQEWDENIDLVTAVSLAAAYVPGSPAEKKLLRKLDFRVVPCCWLLFVLGFLDRANIGNARTGGLADDFKLSSNQYSVILLVFFVSYVIFEIPSNMVLARVRPSLYLCGLAICWGAVAASMGATQNWQQLAGVRFVLGFVESGFAPGIAFYLSSWYRRYELASRFAFYYTAVAVAGGLSGLLAGLITQYLDGVRGIAGWRWLFIIDGVGSSFVGCILWFFMADYPSNTRWLTPEEQLLAAQRLAYDGIGNTQGAHGRTHELTALRMVVTDWRTWILALLYALVTGAQTIQYFIPTLVNSFGWVRWEGQYHTIPPYACAVVCIVGMSRIADHFKNKSIFVCLFAGIGAVCFIIVTASTNQIVRYIFTIFAFGCIYGTSPLVLMWVPNVLGHPAEKRAVAIGLVNALGNTASIYGVFLWPSKDAPRYIPGFSATTIWMGCICIVAVIAGYLFKKNPLEIPDADEVVAAEIGRQRQRGLGVGGDKGEA
ncbi:major facilitator superfamily domain-containing protein [Lipomyces chichibuensis]|uniref:major facilitator superfamily domain-containing protein n=1 Tax=Lipomyces chichibuensis TaxID=1546026 RepID=UPI003343D46A